MNFDLVDRFSDGPRLLADIGGTNARFVLELSPGQFAAPSVLSCSEFSSLINAIKHYLDSVAAQAAGAQRVCHAAIAVANPVEGDVVKIMNNDWEFSTEALRLSLGFDTLLVVNDFTALAMALPHLQPDQRLQVGGGVARATSVIGLIGSGTGLGVSGLIPSDGRWTALGSEGGHASFAPCDQREMDVLAFAWREMPHVSAERLLSGRGLELIYRALGERAGKSDLVKLSASEVTSRAQDESCPICIEAVDCFCAIFGSVAGNVAMTLGALGGIYIGGGIVPRLGPLFARSPFRRRFEAKGRLANYLAQIPTYVITAEYPTFVGTSAILAENLKQVRSEAPILEEIRQQRARMSPSESKVANWVLKSPRALLGLPIAEIAQQAGVSQPTVIRFCRTIGVSGVADFKLKLASALTGGAISLSHCHVETSDTDVDLARKVLGNNASATLALRDMLDVKSLTAGIKLLRNARRVELLSTGSSRVVAEDMQHKLLNLGIVSNCFSDPNSQEISAGLLTPDDVALVISRSGETPELLRATKAARARGANILAVTASGSSLAKLANVLLALNHTKDDLNMVPAIVRLLQLMLLDLLAAGLARSDSTPESGGRRPAIDALDIPPAIRQAG
ncbi:glucokinase [Massilia cavernae]|uniref:Glucokinase n=1 Tax=Massilia cavernae TaxID=2320864 RepID=A0A418Y7X8_9BURK|nr:glucokinase [Massilia cavernae]RJG27172.1 glucokinase [Massilia cavernae]